MFFGEYSEAEQLINDKTSPKKDSQNIGKKVNDLNLIIVEVNRRITDYNQKSSRKDAN